MIVARHISKSYRKQRALHDISFQVPEGSIFGIMGANGAGKSTLFEIMTTLLPNFKGELKICGMDVRLHKKEIHQVIGYVPGRFSLYEELTTEENLSFFARIYGCSVTHIHKNHASLWESLSPFAASQTRYLSGGMKQKLAVCCALVHDPAILFLDEPTTGIDPRSRHELWQELSKLRKRGVTILASTHYLSEVNNMDQVLFLHQGEQLLLDTPQRLLDDYDKELVSVTGLHPYKLFTELKNNAKMHTCYLSGKSVRIPLDDQIKEDDIRSFCRNARLTSAVVQRVSPGIEDVFIRHLSQIKQPVTSWK